MKLVGLDGCKRGWVVAMSDESLQTLEFEIADTFSEVFHFAADSTLLVVDIPIGLAKDDVRACDRAARNSLGSPRNTSVFSAPCRATLYAATYTEACTLNIAARGKAVSQQLFGILPKIREVDAVMTPERQRYVREAHPEVIFATLTGIGSGLVHAKQTADGERERLALLSRYVPVFDPVMVRSRLGAARVGRDDIIDAVACLVTAYRIFTGVARVLPEGDVPRDEHGLRMEIVA